MGYHHNTHSFDPTALSILYAAFDRAWKLVAADNDASSSGARDRISLTIMALAAAGETDVERLATNAVAREWTDLSLPRQVIPMTRGIRMAQRLDDARKWHARAKEAREMADQLTNPESKRIMLGIAVSFVALAQLAAERDVAKRRA